MSNSVCPIWDVIAKSSYDFEHSMDPLHRKQTGSYYTALELTYAMMRDLVDSLSSDERRNIHTKTFLEPCVGTGNFVFAYLVVCKELNLNQEQYCQLLNNIYVCDINDEALRVYQENLTALASQLFQINLESDYFESHIFRGLLFDVDSKNVEYIPIQSRIPSEISANGFDFVVTNPPYKNLKAERGHYDTEEQYESDKTLYAQIGALASHHLKHSTTGTLNLYKMFVEEIADKYTAQNGYCSLLIPASILTDKSCSKLRTFLFESSKLQSVRIISEDSSFVDASQALCAIQLHRGEKNSHTRVSGSLNGISQEAITIPFDDMVDPSSGNSILVLSTNEYKIRKIMQRHPTIKELSYISNLRGELDLTLNKTQIISDGSKYRLLRGRNIGYYQIIETDEVDYVSDAFVNSTAKQKYIKKPRLICQQIANMAKKRRVSYALAPADVVLGNSCNFLSIDTNEDGVDEYFMLGVLNSPLIDWFFKLSSSNNHINNYEIDTFPIPVGSGLCSDISKLVREYLDMPTEDKLQQINRLVSTAYGISENEEESNVAMIEVQPKVDVATRLFEDLKHMIPTITIEECQSVIEGSSSLIDISFQKRADLSDFDKKVLAGIEAKYRGIAKNEVLNHTSFKLSDLDLEMIKPVPQGGSWKDIPEETVKKSKRLMRITQTGGRTTLYGRIDYSKPSYTITTYFNRPGNGTYVHPTHERVLTVREAARFQTFPDDYYFCGNKTDMLKQVGNAVPVMLAYAIGKKIVEKTGCHTSVDLFSGAGGMTYGFKLAGIHAQISNDIVENACVTLKTNSPEIDVYCGDITKDETKQRIIQAGVSAKADIICGGPPCQGFSLAGFRMANDPRNELFRHFVDIVSGVNPKVIVFENVEGILSYQGGETYRNIIELFSELGYNCEGRKLLAHHYGVPQKRKRVIILCVRKDLGVLPADLYPDFVTPNDDRQVTAFETIYDLDGVECNVGVKYKSDYTSPILKYFKGEITAAEYLRTIQDDRGVVCMKDDVPDDEEEDEDDSTSKKQTKTNNTANQPKQKKVKSNDFTEGEQLSLFDD